MNWQQIRNCSDCGHNTWTEGFIIDRIVVRDEPPPAESYVKETKCECLCHVPATD